jgi:hypothetical protein
MKIKLLSAMVASALAGMATTASAGVIQASYKNYASEVFGTDAVVMTAPTVNYALALPLSGTPTNANTFSISWTLASGGEFVAAPANTTIGLFDPAGLNETNPTTVTLSANKQTLTATFTVISNYTVGSQIVLGSGGPITITKVGTILGAPALENGCGTGIASVTIAVKLKNAAGSEFDSNFTLAPLSNTTPIVQSSVALSVTAKDSATYSTPEKSKVNVLVGSLGKYFTDITDVTSSDMVINIGEIDIKNKATLFDLDGLTAYSVKDLGGTQGTSFGTNPATGAGIVEANSLKVDVSGKFLTAANGGSFFASTEASCDSTLAAGTIATTGLSASVTLSAANVASLATSSGPMPVYLCYATSGSNVIPTSQFAVTGGALGKFTNSLEASNPVCPAPIYKLGANGVKVDVRNYIPLVAKTASGWYSVIRVINTDEQQGVSPVIQALLASGQLGSSTSLDPVVSTNGKSGPFAPLEVRYYTTTAIDTALNAAATPAAPSFGADDVGGNARLRITASSSSIRVQNYQYNPTNGNFLESSAAQSDEGPEADQQNTHNNR